MENKEYYLRNKDAGYLGNSFVWWAIGGAGYTAYINGAERFTEAEALAMVAQDRNKWEMYDCAEIDKRLHLVFDSQDVRRLGSDEITGQRHAPAKYYREPDFYYEADNWECTYPDLGLLYDELDDDSGVLEVGTLYSGTSIYIAAICTETDEEGDPLTYEYKQYPNEAAAIKAQKDAYKALCAANPALESVKP